MNGSRSPLKISARRPRTLLVLPAVAAAAAGLAACGSSGSSSSAASSGSSASTSSSTAAAVTAAGLKTTTIGGAKVLTNAKGFVLYSFGPDTKTMSKCNGACATAWPPVTPSSGSTVKSPFATIKRSDGATQLSFLGHPLYTFVGDKTAGKATGNNVNAEGGVWHEALASAGTAAASTSSSGGSSTSGGSSGGYGY
jgi:predicted lipoprotein with Yx(FWY)xxD motif